MVKNIEGFKKCPVKNPALHEGLLLLIYEFLKTQTRGKSIGVSGGSSEDTASSDTEDLRVVKSVKIETPSKASPSPRFPSRKSPRCLPPIPPSPHPKEIQESSDESETESEEEESETGKDSEMEVEKEKDSDREEETPLETQDNPKKRKVDQTLPQDHPSDNAELPPSPTAPNPPLEIPILPPEEMIEIMIEKGGEVIRKNKRRAWSNFNVDKASMGIVREPAKIQVLGDLDSSTHYDELLDPALLVLSDNVRETGFNFLNNAKNSLIDNFRSIKWLFQEIEALKDRSNQANNRGSAKDHEARGSKDQVGSQGKDRSQDPRDHQEDRITRLEQKVQRLDAVHQIVTKQIVDTLHTLNENIVNLGDYLTTTGLEGNAEQNIEHGTNQEDSQKEAGDQENQGDQKCTISRIQEGEASQKESDAAETLQAMDKEGH